MSTRTLIRDVRLIDGTGAPWYRADLISEDGRIAAITPPGRGEAAAGDAVIEADGRYLAPGFIDSHTHDDLISLRHPDRLEKVVQGVTTVVGGNCGFSLFPAVPASRGALRDHFGRLLGEVADHEVFTDYRSFAGRVNETGLSSNFVALVGHAALRLAVMGFDNRPATAAERQQMCSLLAEQFEQGAAGLSFGLVYPPSAYADDAELRALAGVASASGRLLAAHIRSYEGGLLSSVDEFLEILRGARTAGLLSHLQAAGQPYWGKAAEAAKRLEQAREEGIDVSFDMYPYPAGSSTILQLLPPSAQAGGFEALAARLRDPRQRSALRAAIEDGVGGDAGWDSKIGLIGWHNVRVSGVDEPALKEAQGASLAALGERWGKSPFEAMVDLILGDLGRTSVVMFQLSEDDLATVLSHRLHMLGSDSLPREGSLPHPRACGSFPRFIGHYALTNRLMPLEEAVRKMTALPAQRFRLLDRGLLRPGMVADMVLFGRHVMDGATFDEPLLPPTGIDDVWVGGEPVIAGGQPGPGLAARPGRLLGAA
jgi:N-acyl-D-amino-acid deacylase